MHKTSYFTIMFEPQIQITKTLKTNNFFWKRALIWCATHLCCYCYYTIFTYLNFLQVYKFWNKDNIGLEAYNTKYYLKVYLFKSLEQKFHFPLSSHMVTIKYVVETWNFNVLVHPVQTSGITQFVSPKFSIQQGFENEVSQDLPV